MIRKFNESGPKKSAKRLPKEEKEWLKSDDDVKPTKDDDKDDDEDDEREKLSKTLIHIANWNWWMNNMIN